MRALGFDGPFVGTGKHAEFMQRGNHTVKLPNVHTNEKDIGRELLKRILANAGIPVTDYLAARRRR